MHRWLGVLLALLLAAWAPAAQADDDAPDSAPGPSEARAAVYRVDVTGMPDALREELATSLAAGLAAAGFRAVTLGEVRRALGDGDSGCRAGACLAETARRLDARYLLIAAVVRTGDNYDFELHLMDAVTGAAAAESTDTCELCAFARLRERVTIGVSSLRARMLAEEKATADVEAYKDKLEAEKAAELSRLEAEAAAEAARRRRRTWSPATWGALPVAAVGFAAVAAGVWFLNVHGRGACRLGDPVYPDDPDGLIEFPDPAAPGEYRCRYLYNTVAWGAASVGIGAAALVGATVWVVLGRTLKSVKTTVAPLPGGAAVLVRGDW